MRHLLLKDGLSGEIIQVKIQNITVGMFEVNCWVLSTDSGEALVIDPGDDAPSIQRLLERDSLHVAAYLLTHGHVDHISALADLYDKHPAPIAMHSADAEWAFTEANEMLPYYPLPREPARIERFLSDGQVYTDAGLTYKILATPGHSPGSVCIHFPEQAALFSGDTLFAGSIGRTDFHGGNPRAMTQSLRRLKELPAETKVYSGHGPQTTIEQEQKTNFFLRA